MAVDGARHYVSSLTRHADDIANAQRVAALVENSISINTRRAYRSDWAHFAAGGGRLPASPAVVASYLASYGDELCVATLARRLATISKAHSAKGLPNPCRSELVRATFRGIRRSRGISQREAQPLLKEDLFRILDATGGEVSDIRDRALLLIGFAGGLRRSELVGLDGEDIEQVRHGIVISLRRSKIDQEGRGRRIGIPHGRSRHCPVMALEHWISLSGTEINAVFRPVDRSRHILPERLSGGAVSIIVKKRVAAIGLDATRFSGHSLRAGFVTSATQVGVPSHKTRAQTGHASDIMLARYIRENELFIDNAAGALL